MCMGFGFLFGLPSFSRCTSFYGTYAVAHLSTIIAINKYLENEFVDACAERARIHPDTNTHTHIHTRTHTPEQASVSSLPPAP